MDITIVIYSIICTLFLFENNFLSEDRIWFCHGLLFWKKETHLLIIIFN